MAACWTWARFTAGTLVALALALHAPLTARAEAGPSDLQVTAETIARSATQRTIRTTLTNLGPQRANVDSANEFPGTDRFIAVGFDFTDADVVASPAGCRDGTRPERPEIRFDCYIGETLDVGEVRTFDFTLRPKAGNPYFSAGTRVQFSEGDFNDPDNSNNSAFFPLAGEPGCVVSGASPQKLTRRGARFRVKAPAASGCVAKLRNATLKIGTRKYVFVRPRPERKIAAGGAWRLDLAYGKAALAAIRKALKRKRTVTVSAEFMIDGVTSAGKVTLK